MTPPEINNTNEVLFVKTVFEQHFVSITLKNFTPQQNRERKNMYPSWERFILTLNN